MNEMKEIAIRQAGQATAASTGPAGGSRQAVATQETTAMLFVYTNATLLLNWSKERSALLK